MRSPFPSKICIKTPRKLIQAYDYTLQTTSLIPTPQRGFPAQAGCSRGLAPVLFGLPETVLFSRARAPGAVMQSRLLPVHPQQCSGRCWVPGLRAGQ